MKYLKHFPKIKGSLRNLKCFSVVRAQLTPFTVVIRRLHSKDDDGCKKKKDNKPPHEAKEELNPAPIPGFCRADNPCAEGLFTQEARQQIEEQKKKQAKPTLKNPET